MKYGFGVDVGGTTVKLGLLSEAGELLEKWELPTRTENGGENILPDIARSVQDCMARRGLSRDDCLGLGIGVPGPALHWRIKMALATELSLRGGRRPTWRPEREEVPLGCNLGKAPPTRIGCR